MIVAGGWSPEIEEFVRAGGKAILLQYGDGALPVERVPFWRESIKLFYDHPALRAFPHEGYADMQFYHLATDAAFDRAGVAQMIEGSTVMPVLRRLDARRFTTLEYLAEVRLGAGRMLISTLRFQGGQGDQVRGLRANAAGAFLLRQMVDALTAGRGLTLAVRGAYGCIARTVTTLTCSRLRGDLSSRGATYRSV